MKIIHKASSSAWWQQDSILASTLLTSPVGVVGVCRSLLCCGRCIIGNSKAGEGRGGGMTGVMTSSGSLVTCDTNAWKGMTVHIVIYCLFLDILLATLQAGWVNETVTLDYLLGENLSKINCIVFPVLIDSLDALSQVTELHQCMLRVFFNHHLF